MVFTPVYADSFSRNVFGYLSYLKKLCISLRYIDISNQVSFILKKHSTDTFRAKKKKKMLFGYLDT